MWPPTILLTHAVPNLYRALAAHAVVDAGQLVGVGLHKPAPHHSSSLQHDPMDSQSNNSNGMSIPAGRHQQQPTSSNSANSGYSTSTGGAPTATTTTSGDHWGAVASSGSGGPVVAGEPMTSEGVSSSVDGGKKLAPRIFTFGIGPYCNHYFLKRLAGGVGCWGVCVLVGACAGRSGCVVSESHALFVYTHTVGGY